MDLHMIKLSMVLIEPMLNLITLKGVIFLFTFIVKIKTAITSYVHEYAKSISNCE